MGNHTRIYYILICGKYIIIWFFICFLDRSLEQSMFSKANELQEDISKKKYEFRTTQMHLAAFKSQVRIKKDSLFHCNFFFCQYYRHFYHKLFCCDDLFVYSYTFRYLSYLKFVLYYSTPVKSNCILLCKANNLCKRIKCQTFHFE